MENNNKLFGAVCALGCAGIIIFATLPTLLNTVALWFNLNDTQIGDLAAAYFLIYTLVTLSSPFWLPRLSPRTIALSGFSALTLAMVFAANASTADDITIAMLIAGLGGGLCFALSFFIVTKMPNLNSKFAVKLIVEQIIPAIALFTIPVLVTPHFGAQGFFYSIAVISVLLASGSFLLEKGLKLEVTANADAAQQGKYKIWIALLALTISFGSLAAIWAFLEVLGVELQLEEGFLTQVMGLAALMGAAGPLLAFYLDEKLGLKIPLWVSQLSILGCLIALSGQLDASGYALCIAIFACAWYFSLVFQMSIIAFVDATGKYAVLIAAAMPLGAIIGPVVFPIIKTELGLTTALIYMGAASTLAIILLNLVTPKKLIGNEKIV
ncbi:MFS transporter [Paraferrimonas sp. SM1919]|uniref:MFS transporter n=1 Tax=Paraferrimonas sp. SM1919 TaxID=2662263 RepID=UPI0013D85E4E|nr:MFS transporter [Paraferrimonas sp. SM1919]